MIQVLEENKRPSFAQSILGGISEGIGPAIQNYQSSHKNRQANQMAQELLGVDVSGLNEKTRDQLIVDRFKNQAGTTENDASYQIVKERFGDKFANLYKASPEGAKTQLITHALDAIQRGDNLSGLLEFSQPDIVNSNETEVQLPKKPPGITPKEWAKQKSTQLYDINKPILKEAGELRKNLAMQEQAIEDLMESSPDVGIRDWMADYFDIEPLRSESGAKFKTAVKEFFLADMPRVGVRPNQWVEKQLLSALPVAGRSPTSNMITTAGLRFKKDISKKRLEIIDELSNKYGYSEIDLDKTANKMIKSYAVERQKLLENEIRDIKNRESKLSGKTIEVIGPDGEEYEVDESEIEILPEGYLIK